MHLRKRLLVTGGDGSLAPHLCARLMELGLPFICVYNLFTGTSDNITHMMYNKHYETLKPTTTHPIPT